MGQQPHLHARAVFLVVNSKNNHHSETKLRILRKIYENLLFFVPKYLQYTFLVKFLIRNIVLTDLIFILGLLF